MSAPVRLPDAASPETVLAGLASADVDLIPALAAAFPSFEFGVGIAPVDDDGWRDTWSVIRPNGTRLGWFFLMTHGHWVDPDPDARVLLR